MARFGLLYLSHGKLAGRQIVPQEWIEESLTAQIPIVEGRNEYGYWWWLNLRLNMRLAVGWGGQVINLQTGNDDIPDNVIKVSTAAGQEAAFEILRAIGRPDSLTEPLPPNPSGATALAELLAELENPAPRPIPPNPPLARKISGQRYSLEENRLAIEALTFRFEEASSSVRIERASAAYEAAIGLDGRYRITATGEMGFRPDDNHYAFRGEWTDASTFVLEYQEIARPVHFEARLTFEGDDFRGEITRQPNEFRFSLTGKADSTFRNLHK